MKGFDFKLFIEKLRNEHIINGIDCAETLGDNWYEILYDNMPIEQKEEMYLNYQKEKYTEAFRDISGLWQISSEDSFYFDVYPTINDLKEMVDYQKENLNMENLDNSMIVCINGIRNALKSNAPDKMQRVDLLRNLEKTFVESGHNFYPLMRCIRKEIDKRKEQGMETEDYEGTLSGIESVVENKSPYKEIFDLAEKLGKIKEEINQLEKEGKDTSELEDKEADYRISIGQRIKDYDLDYLNQVVNNKYAYMKESNKVMSGNLITSYTANMDDATRQQFKGLESVILSIKSEMNRQKQNEITK